MGIDLSVIWAGIILFGLMGGLGLAMILLGLSGV